MTDSEETMTQPGDENYLWEFQGEDFVFARLDEDQAAAAAMPAGEERDAALLRIESLRFVAADHCFYVDPDGKNYGHCITCEPVCGIPCRTILRLARVWRTHPDYKPAWNAALDDPDNQSLLTGQDWELARLGGFRNLYYARRKAS